MINQSNCRRMLDKSLHSYISKERLWEQKDHRGRWLVLEPGPARLLKSADRRVRDYVDATTERRGRRFSSLAQARAFARKVGSIVRRWRRQMSLRIGDRTVKVVWECETNPGPRVAAMDPWAIFFSKETP